MRRWRALFSRMHTTTAPRIDRHAAERLLARAGDADHPGLARLLAAASAAPTADELAGESAAVAAFAAGRRTGSAPTPATVRPVRRLFIAKVAVAGSLALVGGTALAAETGILPDRLQRQAHELFSGVGVPAPRTTGAAPSRSAAPAPPAPSATPAPLPSHDPADLCRAWRSAQNDPAARQLTGEERRALGALAGGTPNIGAYCESVLGGDPPAPPGPGDSGQPGRGNGRDKSRDPGGNGPPSRRA